MYSVKEIVSYFSDHFAKGKRKGGTIYNLVSLFADELALIKETNTLMLEWRDIDRARGQTLDLIGSNINQPRGKATDEVYRILLKSKIARNLSDGTVDTIIQVVATALNADLKEIKIKEAWETNPDALPTIELIQLPIKRLLETGMDPVNFAKIVQRTVASGVKVEQIELAGTFRLGNVNSGKSAVTGFGSIDGITGGTLSAIYVPGKIEELPI